MGILFYAGKPVGERGSHEIMGSRRHSGSRHPHQDDFPLEGLGGHLSREHIGARSVGKGLVSPVVVEEQHALAVGGNFHLAHLDGLADAHGNIPSSQSRRGRGDLQAEGGIILPDILDDQRIPAHLPVRIGKDIDVPEALAPSQISGMGAKTSMPERGGNSKNFLGSSKSSSEAFII